MNKKALAWIFEIVGFVGIILLLLIAHRAQAHTAQNEYVFWSKDQREIEKTIREQIDFLSAPLAIERAWAVHHLTQAPRETFKRLALKEFKSTSSVTCQLGLLEVAEQTRDPFLVTESIPFLMSHREGDLRDDLKKDKRLHYATHEYLMALPPKALNEVRSAAEFKTLKNSDLEKFEEFIKYQAQYFLFKKLFEIVDSNWNLEESYDELCKQVVDSKILTRELVEFIKINPEQLPTFKDALSDFTSKYSTQSGLYWTDRIFLEMDQDIDRIYEILQFSFPLPLLTELDAFHKNLEFNSSLYVFLKLQAKALRMLEPKMAGVDLVLPDLLKNYEDKKINEAVWTVSIGGAPYLIEGTLKLMLKSMRLEYLAALYRLSVTKYFDEEEKYFDQRLEEIKSQFLTTKENGEDIFKYLPHEKIEELSALYSSYFLIKKHELLSQKITTLIGYSQDAIGKLRALYAMEMFERLKDILKSENISQADSYAGKIHQQEKTLETLLYNRACAYSLQGQNTLAFEDLTESFKMKSKRTPHQMSTQYDHLINDRDLDSLKATERFKKWAESVFSPQQYEQYLKLYFR